MSSRQLSAFTTADAGWKAIRSDRRLTSLEYTVTHHRVTRRVVERSLTRLPETGRHRRLVTLAALGSLAMTAPGRRIAKLLVAGG